MHHTITRHVRIFLYFLCLGHAINAARLPAAPPEPDIDQLETARMQLEAKWNVRLDVGITEFTHLANSLEKFDHENPSHHERVSALVNQLENWGTTPSGRDIREKALEALAPFVRPLHTDRVLDDLQLFYRFYADNIPPIERQNRLHQARALLNAHPDEPLANLEEVLFPPGMDA